MGAPQQHKSANHACFPRIKWQKKQQDLLEKQTNNPSWSGINKIKATLAPGGGRGGVLFMYVCGSLQYKTKQSKTKQSKAKQKLERELKL